MYSKDEIAIPIDWLKVKFINGYAYLESSDGYGKKHRTRMGKLIDSTPGQERILPSAAFKSMFPEYVGEINPSRLRLIQDKRKCYLFYVLGLVLAENDGLYPLMEEYLGGLEASRLLCDGLLSVLLTSSSFWVTVMEDSLSLSDQEETDLACQDEEYRLHGFEKVTQEAYEQLLTAWMKKYADMQASSLWVYFYEGVVCLLYAETGRPAACFPCERVGIEPFKEGLASSEAILDAIWKVRAFLKDIGMPMEGVFLSSEEAREEILVALEKEEVRYLYIPDLSSPLHRSLFEKYGDMIAGSVRYWVTEACEFCQGFTESWKGPGGLKGAASLVYCNGGKYEQFSHFVSRLEEEEERVLAAVRKGRAPKIREPYRKFLSICEKKEVAKKKCQPLPDGSGFLLRCHDEINQVIHHFGFFSLVHPKEMSLSKAYNLHKGKEDFGTQLALLRIQKEQNYKAKTFGPEEGYGSLFTAYLAAYLRMEIEEQVPVGEQMQDLVYADGFRFNEGAYELLYWNEEQERLFQELGYDKEMLSKLLEEILKKRLRGKNDLWMQEAIVRPNTGKRGRPRKTEEEKQAAKEAAKAAKQPGKPGRPAGTKDTKPRKERSDKGKKRGPRGEKAEKITESE